MAILKIRDDITRIDLEKNQYGVIVKFFKRGWQVGCDMTDLMHCEVEVGIATLLRECELAGFTVSMKDQNTGRALRGETTRVDIVRAETGWRIDKYPFGWMAKTRPLTSKVTDEAEAKKAVAWLRENGWTVREWPNGYRAWKGEVLPVRDASTIRYLRNQVDRNRSTGHADERHQFNLALDF